MRSTELAAKRGESSKSGSSHIESVDVDFGTYHHSTPEESSAVRARAEAAFIELMSPLYPSNAALEILDAGCGLGFLMAVAAKCFAQARITGIDLFKHASVSNLSMASASKNMKALGLESRTSFLTHDLARPLGTPAHYDLVVSNVVFHNMGKKRFKGYETVFDALKPGGFFIIGDLFSHDEEDMNFFRECSTLIQELDEGGSGPWAYKIKVLRMNQ